MKDTEEVVWMEYTFTNENALNKAVDGFLQEGYPVWKVREEKAFESKWTLHVGYVIDNEEVKNT